MEIGQNLVNLVFSKISYFILKCIVNYGKIELNASENANKNEIISGVNKFFSEIKNIELLWITLADKLNKYDRNRNNWK